MGFIYFSYNIFLFYIFTKFMYLFPSINAIYTTGIYKTSK